MIGRSAVICTVPPGTTELQFHEGPFAYVDSYVGGSDFLGEEIVFCENRPVWAMNYYGYLLEPHLIDAPTAGRVIKASLTALYGEGRFLGGWVHQVGTLTYVDESTGGPERFHGIEHIQDASNRRLYELRYHGGLVRD